MWTFSTQTSIYEGDWLKSPEINNTKQAGTVPGTQVGAHNTIAVITTIVNNNTSSHTTRLRERYVIA